MEKAEQKEWNLWEIYDDTQLQELEKLNEAYKAVSGCRKDGAGVCDGDCASGGSGRLS